jgi:hypothetical protein
VRLCRLTYNRRSLCMCVMQSFPEMYFAVSCLLIPIVANVLYKYVSFDNQPVGYTIYVTGLGAVSLIIALRTLVYGLRLLAASTCSDSHHVVVGGWWLWLWLVVVVVVVAAL